MDTTMVREFRKNLRQLERLIVSQLKGDTCCHGVSIAQCHCLLAVELLDLPSQNELADHLGLEKSTLSRTVDGLVKIGLLQRIMDESDRRIVRIGLTLQGQITCDAINQVNDEFYGRVLEGMDIAREQAVTVFAEFARAMTLARKTGATCLSITCREDKENGM